MHKRGLLAIRILLLTTVCLGIGFLSGMTTAASIADWYEGINKPVFTPPGWVFAPVWTTLYIIMGVSAAWIWNVGEGWMMKKALLVFSIHLFLNALWTQLFFGLRSPEWAFIEIIFLLLTIIYYSVLFYRIQPWTSLIQIPYLLWVSFATVLTGTIAWMN